MSTSGEAIIVIGAGSTGAAVAHDLALRGLPVVVLERGEPASGTTGRNHALLHSGGRYVVKDLESALECRVENELLHRLAPEVLERNGGLFVALDEEDMAYRDAFLAGCQEAGIPYRELSREEALRREPGLNPAFKTAIEVPDGVFDPYRLVLAWLATAQANGARVYPYTWVEEVERKNGRVVGVWARHVHTGRRLFWESPMVVNAAGPWAGRIAELAGAHVPIRPSPGVIVAVDARLNHMVVNRLRKPGDGDIIVPQRRTSLIGTTSWIADSPDRLPVPADHIEKMIVEGARLLPAVARVPVKAALSSARPLVAGNLEGEGREISRTFQTFDHEVTDRVANFVTIAGGKTTTSRAMAETLGDLVCRKLGIDAPCRTRETPLHSYRRYRVELPA